MTKEELQKQVNEFKIRLYDIMEVQALLTKQFDRHEQTRREALKQLNVLRQQLANFKEEPKGEAK